MGIGWDVLKNEWLKIHRQVSFEILLNAKLVAVEKHPARHNQRLMIFEWNDYIWIVPCVIEGNDIFMKTAFRSRKFTRRWRRGDFK